MTNSNTQLAFKAAVLFLAFGSVAVLLSLWPTVDEDVKKYFGPRIDKLSEECTDPHAVKKFYTCECKDGYFKKPNGTQCELRVEEHCDEYENTDAMPSEENHPVKFKISFGGTHRTVSCMRVDNKLWTVLLDRVGNAGTLPAGWMDYLFGYGYVEPNINPDDVFLGFDWWRKEILASKEGMEAMLLVYLKDGTTKSAKYKMLGIDSSKKRFALHLNGYEGNLVDIFIGQNGFPFSTGDSNRILLEKIKKLCYSWSGNWAEDCENLDGNDIFRTDCPGIDGNIDKKKVDKTRCMVNYTVGEYTPRNTFRLTLIVRRRIQ